MNRKEMEQELAQHRDSLRVLREREAELTRELGHEPPGNMESRHRREDEDVVLWDRLSAAEVHDLYANDKEKWDRLREAKQQAGLRKLFGGRT
jgi:hypothetical protein